MILRAALMGAICAIAWSRPCTLGAGEYEVQNFQVRSVQISTPFGWLPFEAHLIAELIEVLPVKPGPFHAAAYDEGVPIVQKRFNELQPLLAVKALERVRATATFGGLQNCTDNTLDVVYHVYTTNFGFYRSNTFEHPGSELNRTQPPSRLASVVDRIHPEPAAGYNDARGFYGGGRFTITQPLLLADHIVVQAEGSPSSLVLGAALAASRDYKVGILRHADWRLAYSYSDLPAGDAQLLRRKLVAQFAGATRPLGSTGLVVRAGGSMEGGQQQTCTPRVETEADLAAAYGSFKGYAGATFRTGGHEFKGSYGFQAGKAAGYYHKQIGDAAYSLRFQPISHHPFSIETEFAGGSVGGSAPTTERFFGGNATPNFIEGDTWHIPAGPFLRSMAENGLGSSPGTLGGDAFYSANFTIAGAAFVRTLIPAELLEKPNRDVIEIGFATQFKLSEASLQNDYIREDSSFVEIVSRLQPLEKFLTAMKDDGLKRSAAAVPGTPVGRAMAALCRPAKEDKECGGGRLGSALKAVREARLGAERGLARLPSDVRDLLLGFPADGGDPPIPSRLTDLSEGLGTLAEALGSAAGKPILDTRRELDTTHGELIKLHNKINFSTAQVKAAAMLTYARRVEKQLLDEANLYAISPLLLLDTARIWPAAPLTSRNRWAVGGGVRFTLVNTEFTVSYARLLNPQPGESPHAVFFRMNVTNLFR